LSNDQMNNLS